MMTCSLELGGGTQSFGPPASERERDRDLGSGRPESSPTCIEAGGITHSFGPPASERERDRDLDRSGSALAEGPGGPGGAGG